MNKKVFVSMLVLSIVFLVGMYVLKIFFPQEFMMSIQNDKIISIGTFIDSHEWLYYLCCGITAFITYYLYCCACSKRLWLKWYEIVYILITIVLIRVISLYVNDAISLVINWTSFAFLPALCKGDMKKCAFIFTTHSLMQVLSLNIRDLTIYFTNSLNTVTTMLMTFECYFWLLLFYVIFNYKKKEN